MRCTIVGQNLRVLSKAIRLMSKYSDEANLLARDFGIVLQAINSSRSVFCEVIFGREFFSFFDFTKEFECRIEIRSLLLVFKIVNLGKKNKKFIFFINAHSFFHFLFRLRSSD